MKIKYIIIPLTFLFLLSSVAMAEEASNPRLEQAREKIMRTRADFDKLTQEKRDLGDKNRVEARENLRERLATFKDENKKRIIENLDQKIAALNTRMTDHYLDVVTKLENVLTRISERSQRLAASGKNVDAVNTAVNSALEVIAETRTMIADQANKVYNVVPVSEASTKTDLGKVRQALGDDLSKLKEAVKNAHSAVREAGSALVNIDNQE